MTLTHIDKGVLGIAAEFAVASELCRRGIYAQLTLGNRKRTDLLIETDRTMLRVQVKGKQGREWPAVRGTEGRGAVLVLVDFQGKATLVRPDFYVITHRDWMRYARQWYTAYVKSGDARVDPDGAVTWVTQRNYRGSSLAKTDVSGSLERWERIERLLK